VNKGDTVLIRADVDMPHPQCLGQGHRGVIVGAFLACNGFEQRQCYTVKVEGREISYYPEELES
jgi:hypothetical protein